MREDGLRPPAPSRPSRARRDAHGRRTYCPSASVPTRRTPSSIARRGVRSPAVADERLQVVRRGQVVGRKSDGAQVGEQAPALEEAPIDLVDRE